MELKPRLKTAPTVSQRLVISPRLYQSLSVLRLGANDLQKLIQEELDNNPTLEIPEPADLGQETTNSAERDLWEDYLGANRGDRGAASGNRDGASAEELAPSPVTLTEHMTIQLDLENLPDRKLRIGLAIIGSLDDDGYLRESLSSLAETISRPVAEIEEVLAVVQRFDPPGVAARNLSECLVIQLEQMDAGDISIHIARDYLPEVARNAHAEIAKALSVSTARVRHAVELIRHLCPSPGSLFDNSPPAAAIIPDVYARLDRKRVRILANREVLPSLKLSQLYKQMAAAGNGAVTDPETIRYVKEKMQEASRLIHDIDHRRTTVTKVARAIAEAQPEFFSKGPEHLRPLGLEEIARRLKVHPSTVSRAILGKYMSTPYGVFEFRFFFSAGYSTSGGAELSATAVKKRLAGLIADEDASRPLSDQKLVDQLRASGLTISRRTAAKYRETLGIPASWERKRS